MSIDATRAAAEPAARDGVPADERLRWRDIDRATLWRLATVAALVFAQQVPNMFINSTLPTIYRTLGMDLSDYWLFSLPLIPRWLKWLIAPIVDRHALLPIGRRRSWILVCTFGGAVSYGALAWVEPTLQSVTLIVLVLFWAELVMAVQDVSVDAYCVESLMPRETAIAGPMLSIAQTFSFFISSAGIAVIYQYAGWTWAVAAMSVVLFLSSLPAVLRPEPISEAQRRQRELRHGKATFKRALVRDHAVWMFGLVGFAGFYGSFTYELSHVMLVDKGMTVGEIGVAAGTGVALGAVIGSAAASVLLARLGVKQMAILACLLGLAGHGIEVFIAAQDKVSMFQATMAFFLFDLLLAPYFALESSVRLRWTSRRQAGTDFTMQSSVRALASFIAAAAAGPAADWMGWPLYFSTGLVGLAILSFVIVRMHDRMEQLLQREAADDAAWPKEAQP
jgi:hypothetical protein